MSVGFIGTGILEDDFIVTLETNDIVAMNAAQGIKHNNIILGGRMIILPVLLLLLLLLSQL